MYKAAGEACVEGVLEVVVIVEVVEEKPTHLLTMITLCNFLIVKTV